MIDDNLIREILSEKLKVRSQTGLAASMGISVGYLNDVIHNRKAPGDKILKGLGMKRIIVFDMENV
jgi:hypothetical protein